VYEVLITSNGWRAACEHGKRPVCRAPRSFVHADCPPRTAGRSIDNGRRCPKSLRWHDKHIAVALEFVRAVKLRGWHGGGEDRLNRVIARRLALALSVGGAGKERAKGATGDTDVTGAKCGDGRARATSTSGTPSALIIRGRLVGGLVVALPCVVSVGLTQAAANSVIHTCYNNWHKKERTFGDLRNLRPGRRCPPGTRTTSWNIRGSQGLNAFSCLRDTS
jgi:hypothetical protein